MKTKNNGNRGSCTARFPYPQLIKSLFLLTLILVCTGTTLWAQADSIKFTKPTWWYGVAAGANINFYQGTTQALDANLTTPTAFRHGLGAGLFLAPMLEYRRPDSKWGFMLQAGYDSRRGKFNQVTTPCNCPADLSANLAYITVEPSVRFAPFKSNFYLFAGPRLAFNISKSYTYKVGANPLFPNEAVAPEVKGDFSDVNQMLLSMQIGAGYDIYFSEEDQERQTVLSPFVSFQPYFGQNPRSTETWTVTTVRVGAAIKFGKGKAIHAPVGAALVPEVQFSVYSPKNIPVERRVRETFPIRNYVFFDLGSTEIPARYVLLTKDQVKDFKEDRLEVFAPKELSGRSKRQMVVYYNVLNILGDRMGRNPEARVRLAGASMQGEDEGLVMAERVKKYLVDVFGIDSHRIDTEGRIKPRIASEQPGGTKELDLIRQGDRRVSIWSESPAIMQQYQTGPNVPLAPVDINLVEEAPIDSYVTFNVAGAKDAFTSWSLEIKDEAGKIQYFGPFTQEKVMLPGKQILGTRPKGDFKVAMIGHTKAGNTVRKETAVSMALWTPPKDEMGARFSVIYEFGDSVAIKAYDKYLTDVVTPKIPTDATVVIHGYTDVIGDSDYNQQLSLARANDVKSILEKSLANAGRRDVTFEVYGFGEDESLARYGNTYPEERFYNRGVVIDIIPKKK